MKEFIIHQKLMGTAFSLGLVAENEKKATEYLQKGVDEIKRIENLFSEYNSDSITSKINNQPKEKPLIIDKEVFDMIERCLNISNLTNGCFDITAGGLKKLYSFKNKHFKFPSQKTIDSTLLNVGMNNLILDKKKNSITKLNSNTSISFNAIGKGYASDSVKKMWQSIGVQSGFINASGDLFGFGSKADGSAWQVGIAHPNKNKKPIISLPLFDQAVATSGDYEQYFRYQGKRYSHNINPINGLPLHELKSVSIISPSAELSDALATAVYVMGLKKGIDFVNQLPNTFAVIINQNNEVYLSQNIKYENYNF